MATVPSHGLERAAPCGSETGEALPRERRNRHAVARVVRYPHSFAHSLGHADTVAVPDPGRLEDAEAEAECHEDRNVAPDAHSDH